MLFVGALTGVQCEHSRGRAMHVPTDVKLYLCATLNDGLRLECCQKNVIKSKASTDKFIKIERTLCVWLPLARELAAKLTEGENIEFQLNDIVVYLLPLRFIIA